MVKLFFFLRQSYINAEFSQPDFNIMHGVGRISSLIKFAPVRYQLPSSPYCTIPISGHKLKGEACL